MKTLFHTGFKLPLTNILPYRNPNEGPNSPSTEWKKYDCDKKLYLEVSHVPQMKAALAEKRTNFWAGVMPQEEEN